MTPMAVARVARAIDLIQRGCIDDGVADLRQLLRSYGHEPPPYPDTQTLERRRTPVRPSPRPPGGHAA